MGSAIAKNPWLSQTAVIRAIRPEIEQVATYQVELVDREANASYRFQPGQFNMLYLPGAGEIAISVSSGYDGVLEHTIRQVGNVTRFLSKLEAGATIGMRGPYGSSWPIDDCRGQDVLIVAGGIGLAPLRPMLHNLMADRAAYGRIVLLYGARTPDTLLFASQYEAWIDAGIELQTTVDRCDRDWLGNVGVVPQLIDRLTGLRPDQTQMVACGPEVMMRYSVHSAQDRGIPKNRMWLSVERNMQCAVGLCGHCQFGPTFVCKDGPVFRYDMIESLLRVEAL
jgi:NAD(P)H-flavin reductase